MDRNETTKTQKIKSWAKKHQEAIIYAATFTAAAGAWVAIAVTVTKQHNKANSDYNTWIGDFNEWLIEERNKGNAVFQLFDGSYLTIDRNARMEFVNK